MDNRDLEKCARCGESGEDRRTLWMACLYAMGELNVPFAQIAVQGQICKQNGTKEVIGHHVPTWAEGEGPSRHHPFFTLRVCKACRGSWMQAIKQWFNTPKPPQASCGSGIWIREFGALKEISEEEWKQLRGDREPVRFLDNHEEAF